MAPPKYTPEQRIAAFWAKVDKSGGDDACWIWTAFRLRAGYGLFKWYGKDTGAHRVSWELAHGAIPDGLWVLHNCPGGDNPACVNPAHLWLGTQQDNTDDMVKKGRSATGVRHGSRTHPERLLRGERHWTQTRPERRPYGERNGNYTHPESYPHGEEHWIHKLTDTKVQELRKRFSNGETNISDLAREFGVDRKTLRAALSGKTWKHVQ